MSNHSNRRRINLHHQQLHGRRQRIAERYQTHLNAFLEQRKQIHERISVWYAEIDAMVLAIWATIITAIILAGGWVL